MKKIGFFLILSSFVFTISLDHEAIHKEIKSMIKQELSEKYKNVEVQVLKRPKLLFPDEIYTVEIQKPEKLIGMTTVTTIVTGKTKKLKLQYLTKVKIIDEVLVLAESINRKTSLSKANIDVMEKDITNEILANKTILREQDLQGLRTNSFLRKGDILTKANTESIPDVLENTEMSMKINNSNLSVTMIVKALEEGFVGDTIKVMNKKYQKVLLAKVLNKNEVLLVN